ncbi:MAG: hypothetical protein JW943_00545 [Deltaproteobacteria bacterium]|nr:hypothetical protein [Deltaproteobacteria bacterium]
MKRNQAPGSQRRLSSKKNIWLIRPLFLLLSIVVSCSGGSDGDSLAGGGIGGTGIISVGNITALGSIFVNGIEFQTTRATVIISGISRDEKDLHVGMVVKVEGTVNADGNTGNAARVTYDHNVEGPINRIDLERSKLDVMGQTVLVDAQTIIAGLGNISRLADLAADDVVEISGLTDAEGNIAATRITLKTTGSRAGVVGRVGCMTGTTFKINALTVDYSNAILSQFGSAGIQQGDVVDVTGYLASPSTLIAETIEKKNAGFKDNSDVEFEGFIDRIYYMDQSISGFSLILPFGLETVELDASTVIAGGKPIRAGARVQVKGTIQNNMIQAKWLRLL